jgi:hypothetical protein
MNNENNTIGIGTSFSIKNDCYFCSVPRRAGDNIRVEKDVVIVVIDETITGEYICLYKTSIISVWKYWLKEQQTIWAVDGFTEIMFHNIECNN